MTDRFSEGFEPESQLKQEVEKLSPEPQIGTLSGVGSNPTHHIVLNDGFKEVGFVVANQEGDMDERSFRRFPISEPTNPYVTEKQASWGGGFGQSKFENDRSKYWLAQGIDTTKDALVLGPQAHYAKGSFTLQAGFMVPDIGDGYSLRRCIGARAFLAMPFTTGEEWDDTKYVKFLTEVHGKPGNLIVSIHADNSNKPSPGSLVDATVSVGQLEQDVPTWWRESIAAGTLTDATKYWVVWSTAKVNTSDNHWKIYGNDSQSVGKRSADGSTWVNSGIDFFFRVEGDTGSTSDDHYIAEMFQYKNQMYFIKKYDRWNSSELWMNGWRGAADANAGDKTKLEDATQTDWATKITGQEVVRMVAGPASGEVEDYRDVTAGASGELTVSPRWQISHQTKDDYVVINSDYFSEISIPGSRVANMRKVFDVAVAQGMMFLCRGNRRDMVVHREYNNAGVWEDQTDAWQTVSQRATFSQLVPSPTGGDVLWFGTNPGEANEYRPEVCQSVVTAWEDWTMNFLELLWIDPDIWVADDVNVNVAQGQNASTVKITVWNGKVNTVSISDGGTGYSEDDTLTIVDANSSGTATVTVGVTAGVVTSIKSYPVAGYDYVTGVKTTTGGAGTGCTLNVTGLNSFGTGLMAHVPLTDADGAAYTVDIRYMTTVGIDTLYTHKKTHQQAISAGHLTLDFDDATDAQSPFLQLGLALHRAGERHGGERISFPSTLPTTAGAQEVASLGISLGTAYDFSFDLQIFYRIRAFSDTAPIEVGSEDGDNITGLQAYGDPQTLWAFSETGVGEIKNNRFHPVPLRELKIARHPNNGKGNEVHDVYMMFTWRGRLQRYFRQNLEDLGPDFPRQMADIAGDIVDVVTYPGRLYAAIDGGRGGKSLIMVFKGGNWHEIYTGFTGERIRKLYIQAIPGKSDKLWASVGASVMWFPITLDGVEPAANSDYKYRPTGYLDTSWVYTGDEGLDKLYRSVVAIMDEAKKTGHVTRILYQIDDENGPWTHIKNKEFKSQTMVLYHISGGKPGTEIRGNRLRLRVVLKTKDPTTSPVVRSLQHRIYRLPEVKFQFSWLAKISSISINLRGDEEKALGSQPTVKLAFNVLDNWASNTTPLHVSSNIAAIQNRMVVLEPLPSQLLLMANDEGIEEDSIQVSVNDV